jgi:hypothetical protein
MSAMRTPVSAVFCGIALLAGCGGDSAPPAADLRAEERIIATCDPVLGEVSTAVPPTCINCSITDAPNVADDDGYSNAAMLVTVSADGASIRATAPAGVVYPAGSDAGAFLTLPKQTSSSSAEVHSTEVVSTYLGGVLQETTTVSGMNMQPLHSNDSGHPDVFIGIRTQKDFDAVEFAVTNSSYGHDNTWRVHELCSHGWVDNPLDDFDF